MASVGDKLLAKLEKDCAELGKDRSDINNLLYPYRVEIEEDGLKARVNFLDIDRIGCSISRIIIQHEKVGQLFDTSGNMERFACQIEERITYLLEDLRVIEWDKYFPIILIRSCPPGDNSSYIHYYELLISQANQLSLARYQYDCKIRSRTQEPIRLTIEVFIRLIDDLVEIITQHEIH